MALRGTSSSAFSALVDRIYAAGLEPGLWQDTVESIRESYNGSCALLATLQTAPDDGGFSFSRQLDRSDHVEWSKVSPKSAWLDGWTRIGKPQDTAFMSRTIAPWDVLKRGLVYNEYFKPRDMHDSVTAVLFNGQSAALPMVAFSLAFQAGHWVDPEELNRVQALVPHLKRALQISLAVVRAQSARAASYALFERLPQAIVLLDQNERPLYANPAAQSLLAAGDGLRSVAGKLQAAHASQTPLLCSTIGRAVASDPAAEGGSFSLLRPSGRAPLQVTVIPVQRPGICFAGADLPAALLLAVDPEVRGRIPADVLAARFRLTQAESRVLASLVEGETPAAIAVRLGVSINTVRMHLAHLFQKTGTRRQAELVRVALLATGGLYPCG